MLIHRIKVPRWFYAWVFSIAHQILLRSYPACPTRLRLEGKLYRMPGSSAWKDDGGMIVCDLEPFEEKEAVNDDQQG